MKRLPQGPIVLALATVAATAAVVSSALLNPNLQNRIPAPLLPLPQPPVINGPLSQSPPPDVYQPRRLETRDCVTRRA